MKQVLIIFWPYVEKSYLWTSMEHPGDKNGKEWKCTREII